MLSYMFEMEKAKYRTLRFSDESELEGVELITQRENPAAPKKRSALIGSAAGSSTPQQDVEDNKSAPHEPASSAEDQRTRKIRAWLVVSLLVGATLVATILAFNPGGNVRKKNHKSTAHSAKGAKVDLCTHQGLSVPLGILTVHQYSMHLNIGSQLLQPSTDPKTPLVFQGNITVHMKILQETSCIQLHVRDLNISTVSLSLVTEGSHADSKKPVCLCGPTAGCTARSCSTYIKGRKADEMVTIPLGRRAPAASQLYLNLTYTARLGSDRTGLWPSAPYKLPTGKQAVLLTTQLESIHARSVFPCVDDPAYKAEFRISLTVPTGVQALSNMPMQSTRLTAASSTDEYLEYQPTPIMAPYLVSLAVGPLSAEFATTNGNKNVSIWGPPGREPSMRAPLQLAVAALDHYEAYTGVQLPLPKFDLVAVPGKHGAMENWGLLLFDTDRLLVNPETEGAWDVWRSADVICHELAHQWFGNYVTFASWSELMVSEGVASWAEYGCVEAILPALSSITLSHRALNAFGGPLGVHEGARFNALMADSSPSAPPIVPPSPVNPDDQFSVFTYSKGAALMMMVEAYLDSIAPGTCQAGLRKYLASHALGSATISQLFSSLAAAASSAVSSKKPGTGTPTVTPFEAARFIEGMEHWTSAAGYPLLRVGTDDPIVLSQERFCSWGSLAADLHTATCPTTLTAWYLPLAVSTLISPLLKPRAPSATSWLTMNEPSYQMRDGDIPVDPGVGDEDENDDWVVQKGGATGVFRVLYADLQRQALQGVVETLDLTLESGEDSPEALDWRARQLAEVGAVVDDVMQVALSSPATPQPLLPATEILTWAQAVAASPESFTGQGSYALLLPVLQALHRLLDLLAPDVGCSCRLRRWTSELIEPHAARFLARDPIAEDNTYLWIPTHATREEAFSRLMLSPLTTFSALTGSKSSVATLCSLAANSSLAEEGMPDIKDAMMLVLAARPPGCVPRLTESEFSDKLEGEWDQQEDDATAYRALSALASSSAASFSRGSPLGRDILLAFLNITGGSVQLREVPQNLAISHVAHIAHLCNVFGPRAASNGTTARSSAAGSVLSAVLEVWEQLEAEWGSGAWLLLEEVTAVSVTTQQQYAALKKQLQAHSQGGTPAAGNRSRTERLQRLLSRVHGNLSWRANQAVPVCQWLATQQGLSGC